MFLQVTPTPVQHLAALSAPGAALWVKRDDLNHPLYGGNKVRKLRYLLHEAQLADARRLVLLSPAGSHQVLATAIFAADFGLPVTAVLSPQARTDHAERVLRAIVGLGVDVRPTAAARAPLTLARLVRRGDFVIPLGGSSAYSLLGHIDAAAELADEVSAGALPTPDVLVVAMASAGTAVGLAAGLAARDLPTRVRAVCTHDRALVARALVAAQLAKLTQVRPDLVAGATRRLSVDDTFLGDGYARETPASRRALALGAVHGLHLDPSYSAKGFAAALARIDRPHDRTVLFWQTHASAPIERWLTRAPATSALPRELRALLLDR